MDIGIVGLPNVGKSALFKAMTGMHVEVANYPFTTTKPVSGTAPVPDGRLKLIGQYIKTKKYVPATIRLVDIPAIVVGASHGEGMGNAFLDEVRKVDALAHVVRCFEDEDVTHVLDTVDPVRDAQSVNLELILSDLQSLEGAIEKAHKRARTGEAAARKRIETGGKAVGILESERPLRSEHWSDAERAELRALGMLTLKPVLYVGNVDEDDPAGQGARPTALRKWVDSLGGQGEQALVCLCAKIEAELAELEEDEQTEMLEALGLNEPALATLSRSLYALLGLQSFYTAGAPEIRAWTIRKGCPAVEAAGVIHSDIQRGFIRSETYSIEDLVELKSEQAIRAAGRMRSEGKNYILQDGDVCHFLFNV